MIEQPDRHASRRDFLRLTAGAAAITALGGACSSGSDKRAASTENSGSKGPKSLRIAQWGHFVPAYDGWFDNEFTQRWGDEHDIEVVVDHLPFGQLRNRADAEVAAKRGHDIFGFAWPPAAFEDEVIDHREIVEEVEAKVGKMTPVLERSVMNPRTGKYFGFPDYWSANLTLQRIDLWDQLGPGRRAATWEDVLRAAPELRAMGHPVGIGFGPDLDAANCLPTVMHAFGSSVQDADGNLVIQSAATVEAVKLGTALFRTGMTDDVLEWDGASDNRALASGMASLTLDALSALRATEKQDPGLAGRIALAPVPAGPAGRLSGPAAMGAYGIWGFSERQDEAKQFLIDYALSAREAFLRSEFFDLPAFPGVVPDLSALVADDPVARSGDRYALLAEATSWSTNLGHPGYGNAAVDEVVTQYLVPKMFASAARGEMTPAEAVAAAEAEMKPIFAKWRERGKI